MRVEIIEPRSFAGTIADEFAVAIAETIEDRGECCVALSGGKTPGQVYRSLSVPPRVSEIEWSKIKLFLGDERWVPQTSSHSNFHMVQETLLTQLRQQKPKSFTVNTDLPTPEDGARDYSEIIAREVPKNDKGIPTFDLVILGIGEDGHTASLFPHSPILGDSSAFCFAVDHPVDGSKRVTIASDIILAAREVVFIAKGSAKADIVKTVIEGKDSEEKYPARIFARCGDKVTWFLDSEAAAKLTTGRS